MNSSFILEKLGKKFPHNKFDICEAFVYPEESDFLTINRNNYTHEFEVKVSRSDFWADFKKKKHNSFSSIMKGEEYYMNHKNEAKETCDISRYIDSYERGYKRTPVLYDTNSPWASSVWFSKIRLDYLPNRFSFIVPEGMVSKDEVPEYSGLYYVKECGKIVEIKKSKMLHKQGFKVWENLASKYYWQIKTRK